jgi:hypothetical protein
MASIPPDPAEPEHLPGEVPELPGEVEKPAPQDPVIAP